MVGVGRAYGRRYDAGDRWHDGEACGLRATGRFFKRLSAFSWRFRQQRGSGLVGADSLMPEVAGSGLGCRRLMEERVNRERRWGEKREKRKKKKQMGHGFSSFSIPNIIFF